MVCAECGHYFRRVTWTNRQGQKVPVWRCINRLEYGTKHCRNSPTITEQTIHRSIMEVIGKLVADREGEDELLKERMLDNEAIFYEAYSYEQLDRILSELSARLEYYKGLYALDGDEDVQRLQRKMRIITEAYGKIRAYHKARDETALGLGVPEKTFRYRDYDDAMVRRLVKRIEVKTKEKYTLVLKSGQIMEVSIEEDT